MSRWWRAPVGHLAAGVVVPPAELVVAVRLVALLAIGDLRGRAEPEVPVQPLGDGRFRERAARRVAVEAALDGLDLAEAAGADQLDRQAEQAAEVGALLAAGLQDAAGVLDRLLDRQRLGDGQRQRLLAVDVLAGLERLDGHLRVPVVGRGDEHAIEGLVAGRVRGNPSVLASKSLNPRSHDLRGTLAMGAVHVAAQGEGQLSRFHAGARLVDDLQAAALRAADADDAHDEAIVGRRLLDRTLLLGGQELPGIPGRQPRGGERSQRTLEEAPPR